MGIKDFSIVACLLAAGPCWAVPIANPNPALLGDDIDGSGLFLPSEQVIGIEILDLGPLLTGGPASPFPAAGFGGSEFGFYYAGDPSTRTAIFDPFDQDPDPGGPGSVIQLASIDFANGVVYDFDEGAVQSTFTARPGPVGFYLRLAADVVNFFGFGFDTIFSEPARNNGQDMAAAFPLLDDTGFLLGFAAANPYATDEEYYLFGASIVTGIDPVNVPEPGSWSLLLTGLLGLSLVVGRRPLQELG